jgi:hypothetical protein
MRERFQAWLKEHNTGIQHELASRQTWSDVVDRIDQRGREQREALEAERLERSARSIEKMRQRFEGFDFLEQVLPADKFITFLSRLEEMGNAAQSVFGTLSSGAAGAGTAVSQALWLVISGQKSTGDAAKAAFHEWLGVFGQKMTLLALENAAMTLVSVALGNWVGAASHGAAAIAFGAAAAAAGLAFAATTPSVKPTQAQGMDRGLGGGSSAARPTSNVSVTYVINTMTTRDDDVALLVANGLARAKAMGL